MKTIKLALIILCLLGSRITFPQISLITEASQIESLPDNLKYKILSGLLIKNVVEKNNLLKEGLIDKTEVYLSTALYFEKYPSEADFKELDRLGIIYQKNTWTPPLENHLYGFLLAQIPSDIFIEVLSIPALKRIINTDELAYPANNSAVTSIKADLVWLQGYTGTGVKIAVLDSGLDSFYEGSDIPTGYEKRDYSAYPTSVDDNVENTVSGHGTHVAGSVLGRGTLSSTHNSNNGNTPFKGSAPAASLCFLKIGKDSDAGATQDAMVAAVHSAVDTFNADIITMSYGGWDTYHDGSATVEQKFDWAYSQGVLPFVSAGNNAALQRHYSGTAAAEGYSDYIPISVSSSIKPVFNLVWYDGSERRYLTLKYYNSSFAEITTINIYTTSESSRGTESQYTEAQSNFSSGTYYLRVYNPSTTSTFFHLYEYWGGGTVKFDQSVADPFYTSGHPSNADNVISVGAYVSRSNWWDYQNNGPYNFTGQNSQGQIANFSSRGPRVDEAIKPNITAPGSAIISLRDTDVLTSAGALWIDNDGSNGGDANYYVMQGTSMACPVAAGAAALYMQKYPSATLSQIRNALFENTSKSISESYPNSTWGYGKLDIYEAINSTHSVDGYMSESSYNNIGKFTSGRNGFGDGNTLNALKYYTDGTEIYFGITGEITSDDNIILFFDFSGYGGRGNNTLQNSGGDAGVFKYIGGAKMDFDVDFALAFNEGNSTTNFYIDACRYGSATPVLSNGYIGNIANQAGLSSVFDIGSVFGGTGDITIAYNNSFDSDTLNGIEFKLPISAFAGVDNSQTLKVFAIITNNNGYFSNECIPGDPGESNPGDNPDFSALSGGPFSTGTYALPVELSSFSLEIVKEGVKISWQTATEINNYGFQIERRDNLRGLNLDNDGNLEGFTPIGFVAGHGNSNSTKDYSFTDNTISTSGKYAYRLKQIDNDGSFSYSQVVETDVTVNLTYSLGQNYPNPFNPTTKISYTIPETGLVTLKVYNVVGETVAELINQTQEAGKYEVEFSGSGLSNGVYFYELKAHGFSSVKKLMLLK